MVNTTCGIGISVEQALWRAKGTLVHNCAELSTVYRNLSTENTVFATNWYVFLWELEGQSEWFRL